MSDESLELMKRFMHMCWDNHSKEYRIFVPMITEFDEWWDTIERDFQRRCPEPDWEQKCINRCLVEFAPYSKEVIELKLTIMGY